MIDMNSLLAPLLAGGNPWLLLAGAGVMLLLQRFAPKVSAPAPTPTPAPVPQPTPAGRPVLDILARIAARVAPLVVGTQAATPPTPTDLADVTVGDLAKAFDAIRAELATRAQELARHAPQLAPPK